MPQHLKRLIITFAVVIGLFLGFRYLMIPESFGEFGHYRGAALEESTVRPFLYAGTETCIRCHEDVVTEKNQGHHAKLSCEGCHGPAYAHSVYADSSGKGPLPDSLKLERKTDREDCAGCHQLNAARIKSPGDSTRKPVIKLIDEKEHNHIADKETKLIFKCIECHNPHDP